jgi:hypothetical protein
MQHMALNASMNAFIELHPDDEYSHHRQWHVTPTGGNIQGF